MIINPYTINESKITLKKKINYLNKYIYPIYYNNNSFIIQSPIVFLPWGINKYNSLDISLQYIHNQESNISPDKLNNFSVMIYTIDSYFKKLHFFKKYYFKSNIKKHNSFPDIIRISYDKNNTKVYNQKKELIESKMINQKSFAKCIIQVSFIWINKDTYGIKWNISQLKLYTDIIYKPIEYSFIDSDDESVTEIDNSKNPKYA